MFKYDPAAHRARLAKEGYLHLRDVLTDSFVRNLRDTLAESLDETSSESAEWRITGKKRQFVFDFPSNDDAIAFRAGMAALTGIETADFTISERHIKLYDDNAPDYPAPHKDRAASHFSIGLPIALPEGSTVCMFPDLDPGENTENRATFLAQEPAEVEALYKSPAALMLNEAVGDMVVFWGSRLYHERVRSAGTAVLYIKVNDCGEDPLGENIYAELEVA